jgi:DNA-binding SARP family transcriptional activator
MWSVRILILILVAFGTLQAQPERKEIDYGLAFSSHETSKDHRTSLVLKPDHHFSFDRDFGLKFNLAFQRLTNAYGYIVRVIANDSLNIDLVSSPEHHEFSDLTLIVNNKPTDLHFEFNEVSLASQAWTTIELGFSYEFDRITLRWNGKTRSQAFSMKNLNRFQFYFGANDTGKFNTSDAPPIILKNIAITEGKTLTHKWILEKHRATEVYDSLHNELASVSNPNWIIDKHTKFIHRKEFTIARFPSVAFDSKRGVLYATDEKNLYSYDIQGENLQKKDIKEGNPVFTDANQLLYINEEERLINYDVQTNKLLTYDKANDRWGHNDTTYHEPNYWHNNKFWNPIDKSVYTFGGYGFFSYKNNFYRYDSVDNKWAVVKTSGNIPPRYLAASGRRASTDEVLIFGGYGSVSGKQELSPQSFNDLYSFNLRTHRIKKLWENNTATSEDIVFSNSLVVNENDQGFYVLGFPRNKYQGAIKLRQYALATGEAKILADSIPFKFHDEHSFCDLFLSPTTNELVAVTVHKEKENYQVHVYTISYPPLQATDVFQDIPAKANAWLFAIPLTAILLSVLAIIARKRFRKEVKTQTITLPQIELSDDVVADVTSIVPKPASTVLMFGDFQVFDKNGNDITGKFTMTLKELFTLILLHSVKSENGISTTLLQEYLWPDKDELSARNNRNVNIKKLRDLLSEIGEITIENNNSYLRFNSNSKVFFDYEVVFNLLNDRHTTSISEADKVKTILRHVKRGSLLPNLQKSWLDNFKSDISNQIIDTLLDVAAKLDVSKDDKVLLEIADTIFKYDSINQEALVIKCSVLNKKGKYSLAKSWYDHFVKEYKNLYAESYPKTFEEVIAAS